MVPFMRSLIIVTLVTVLQRKPFARGQPDNCPEPHRQLLRDYKAFHDSNKHSPDAKYLIQTCWGNDCLGTGDRVRGTMWALRVAIAHRRILLVDWTVPAAITNFLLPADIDWTFDGLNVPYMHEPNSLETNVFNDAVYRGVPQAVEAFAATKKHVIQTNQHFYVNIMWNVTPVEYDNKVPIGSCYYNFLFKLNSTIVERGEAHLRQLYGSDPVGSYVAWHWRHFDADGKAGDPLNLTRLTGTLECGKQLADSVGVDLKQRPLLLISDFNQFRTFVRHKYLAGVVTPDIIARHLDPSIGPRIDDQTADKALDSYTDVFVDLYLLSRARCLLTSRSGFSKLALWMGGDPLYKCHRDMVKCEEEIVWRRRAGRRALQT